MFKPTLRVKELIKILESQDPELPIYATWEHVIAPIVDDCIEIDHLPDGSRGIIIDVEEY